ncbi:hypothetical protein [Sphaerisporangium perillae]|uniref:hypothetical protein n=1 Tax=Sphaerisporangium perillae TaxID=2935860 RepID=UPI00200EA953|nr:hypothetical protein [Sphaerisporangium perillae]
MADHELIAQHLRALACRLPPQAVEEIADGLHETFEKYLAISGDPERAARAAIGEFGEVGLITAAFFRESPWRRAALTLLATGPLVGAAWGATLVAAHAWTWPVPLAVRMLYGTTLAVTVLALLLAARERRAYRRMRRATLAAALGLIALDVLMLIAIALLAPVPMWPMAIAIPASLIRILATLRWLPTALAR